MRDSLPPGQISVSDAAARLGYTERRLRSIVLKERWNEAPEPAGNYGLTLWWRAEDLDAFLRVKTPRLRRSDLAHRLGRSAGYVSQLVTRRDFRSIPPPSGADRAGDYWVLQDVEAWLSGDRERPERSRRPSLHVRVQHQASAAPHIEHVTQIRSFVNEGHLYRCGGDHFLVYTGESGANWDVSRAVSAKQGEWDFGEVVIHASADRETAISELRRYLARRRKASA